MAITLVNIIGKWTDANGNPSKGKILFALNDYILEPNNRIIGTKPVIAVLDSGGNISIHLYANDDPTVLPVGTSYTVVENIYSANRISYLLTIPHTASVIDLSDRLS